MLVLRLQRTGRKNEPSFRITLAEKRKSAKGKFIEVLGHYLPAHDPAVFECDTERVTHWISRGAIPSDTLARLLKRAGMKDMDKFIEQYTKRKSKKEQSEAAAAPAVPAAAEEKSAEVPKEEEKKETKEGKEKKEDKKKEEGDKGKGNV